MKTLKSLSLKDAYRSDSGAIAKTFLSPAISVSQDYARAVGYFTSDALVSLSTGLGPFIDRGGRIRLIASPHLSVDDVNAIRQGLASRERVISDAITRELTRPMPDPIKDRLGCIAWLVEQEILEIRIAFLEADGAFGLYHEKVGILTDSAGDQIVFTGSANESFGGLIRNFESVEVFRSWVSGESERVDRRAVEFERLWNNDTANLKVIPFPDVACAALKVFTPRTTPDTHLLTEVFDGAAPCASSAGLPHISASIVIRPYQRQAIANWFQARLRGVFRMATGTGKTITALTLMCELTEKLHARDRSLFVVVLCPYQHLVDQWAETAEQFGMDPVRCYEARASWELLLSSTINAVAAGRPFGMAITTYSTLRTEAFQVQLKRLPSLLIVADEVHNAGAAQTRNALPESAPFRLGLSATPELWRDAEGTEELFDYFGEPVFSFGLGEAIDAGALTPYTYHPITVDLDGEELGEYLALSERIGKALAMERSGSDGELSDSTKMLLIKRARILANARAKVPALVDIMQGIRDSAFNLVYCGDGSDAGGPDGADEGVGRQVSQVVAALGHELGMKVARYLAETPLATRRVLLDEFANGQLQALVAIRCLDEGVDVPATRRAFILASSTNPRQFIQRRGRILRRFPGKDRAELYDFLAVPPWDQMNEEQHAIERRLVRRELERVVEFASLAVNGPQALNSLLDLRKRYDLLGVGANSGGIA